MRKEIRTGRRGGGAPRRAILLAAAVFLWPQGADAARVFIDIHSPTARKIRLAIPEFRPLKGRRDALGLRMA